ncbi:UDP-glucose:(heptosyl) LPS alpha-1,3-glucosyltransferase [Buttiauxella gaviniae ATCC 51604]|uniref:UDP-glucose:(Heptosyl) LPS alpha-1,3-glucosyltransferase n=1 Tax=Buttiauxella gaviniae ATCC 51604 TaxID=1354253 RepID=A0A1B7HZG2_9ENTR|nr:glycosyltransferase family 4 protein [Buttiauxella gaviniae]OAT21016.1 UDP-glucose:(heptosyl) LPS alpha-1,3-glucosyltransferase [Buttiauxella gaviniae ATCC 51604]
MKLAIVRQKYRPDGGAERFVSRALSALSKKTDLDITIITRQWENNSQANYNVITCDPSAKNRLQREVSFSKNASKYFSSFDIVQSHERIPGCTIYRAGDGVHKVWLEIRSREMNFLQKIALRFSIFHNYLLTQEKAMFEHPSLKRVICNSEMVKEEIIENFSIAPEKINVIYNCIDTSIWNPDLTVNYRNLMRERYNIPQQAMLLLFVGSGFERKGLDIAIKSISAHSNVWLMVVGNDTKSSRYIKIADNLGCKSRVIFAGVQKETPPFYAMADALIQPTQYDPFPNTILEAMACGLPVLTSQKCGGKEFIDIGVNGFVFDALDWKSFSNAINSLENDFDFDLARKISYEKIEKLSPVFISENLYRLYNEIVENI